MEINIVLFLSFLLSVYVLSGLSYWCPTLTVKESTTAQYQTKTFEQGS